jgi:chromosome segregation ATPase
MRSHLTTLLAVFSLAALPWQAAWADATTEAQLRAALQNATTQIASLEDQVANLQASQAPNVATIEALRAKLQTLSQNGGGTASPADQAKNDKALAALQKQLAAQTAALARTQAAYQQASTAASTTSAANTQLTAQLAALNKQLNTCDIKNAALYQTANQILDAYAHKDDVWGTAANREPFIGFKRVQLQNIVQDDQDKLDDNQLPPAP